MSLFKSNLKCSLSILLFLSIGIVYAQQGDLDRLLNLNLEELMDVEVISASKKPQKISEVPATVRIVTAKQIKERGYFTLEEALADLPGFQFRNILGFNSYVFMRGINSQNQAILLFVDGIQINELNSGGFYAGGQFNLSNVKRIEVVYGPASALYGTNAISGIINIITNDPEDINGLSVSALTGNFKTRNYDFKFGLYDREKHLGFSVSGMYKQSDKADLRGAKGDNNWTEAMENFEDDLSFDGKLAYKNASIGFVFQDKQASRTTDYKTIGSDYLDYGTLWHIRFFNGFAKFVYENKSVWSNRSTLYYRNATVMDNTIAFIRTFVGPTGGQVGYFRPNDLIGIENQFNLKLKRLSAIAGVVLERERLARSFSISYSGDPAIKPSVPPEPEMLSNSLASVYVQLQYKLRKSTELTLGSRYDNSSYYGEVFTPRLSVVHKRNAITTKLLYTEAFMAPKPWDYTYELGNPDLQPETMRSFEIALAYSYSKNLIAQLSVFKNTLNDVFVREVQRQTNGPDVITDGIEIAFEHVKGKSRSFFNYTYNLSADEGGYRIPEIGINNCNAGMLFTFSKHVAFDIRGHFTGRRKNVKIIESEGRDYIDRAFIFHATLSFLNLHGLDLQFICRNLFDTEYYHPSNNPPDRYRQPQRTFMFKLEYSY